MDIKLTKIYILLIMPFTIVTGAETIVNGLDGDWV